MLVSLTAAAVLGYIAYKKLTIGKCRCTRRMDGKVVIITGASSGIGKRVALNLARRGAKVILGCRNLVKGRQAEQEIRDLTGNPNVVFRHIDFESLESVRRFALGILNCEQRLDVLINNAGSLHFDERMTDDNLPVDAQVNYYGQFLLTMILMPLLKASAPSRVINMTSPIHAFARLNPATLARPARDFLAHWRSHANIKLAIILFTKKLARELASAGVTANCVYPGATNTGLYRDTNRFVRAIALLFFQTSQEGAQSVIHLAVAPYLENVTGKYFTNCQEAATSRDSNDHRLASQLWIHTENRVELRAYNFNLL